MKRKILAAILFFSVVGHSQENDPVVLYKPFQADGFLVLNKDYDPNIDHWTIEYSTKNIDESGIVTYNTIDKGSFYGQNYIKISAEYYIDNEVYGTIHGWSESNSEIVIEGPILLGMPDFPVDSFYETWYWTCNGTYYAYEISLMENSIGTGKLRITNAYDNSTTANLPFYQYTTSAGFDGLVGYHEVPNVFAYPSPGSAYNSNYIVHFQNTNNIYYTASGTPITNDVYGIGKSQGPWQGISSVFLDNEFIFDQNSISSFTLGYMINFYNNHGGTAALASEGLPPLECNGAITGLPGGPLDDAEPCSQNTEFILGVDGDINDLLDLLDDDCISVTYEEMEVILEPISAPGGGIVIRPMGTSKFDANGEIITNPITIELGLYRIDIETVNGEYYAFYKEVQETFVNTLEMADFLTPTIFPVPITGEQFTLNLKADAKLKFQYILSDLNGNQLYSKNFVIQKDHDRNHTIKPNGNASFPSGILVNTFIFEDGSILSFETIKN